MGAGNRIQRGEKPTRQTTHTVGQAPHVVGHCIRRRQQASLDALVEADVVDLAVLDSTSSAGSGRGSSRALQGLAAAQPPGPWMSWGLPHSTVAQLARGKLVLPTSSPGP
eukprot:14847748-Heterocapsa_arctica.AAC.1